MFDVLTCSQFWLPLADSFRKKPLRVLRPAPTIANRVRSFGGCGHLWVSQQALFGADCFNSSNGICHLEVGICRVLKSSTFFCSPRLLVIFFLIQKLSCRGLRSSQNYAPAVIPLDDPLPSALSLCDLLVSG